MPILQPADSLVTLASPDWWRRLFFTVLPLHRRFLLPAGIMTAGNLVALAATQIMGNTLAVADLSTVDKGRLMQVAAVGSVGVLVSCGLLIWAFALWLSRLTAFARSMHSKSMAPTARDFDAAAAELKGQAGHLTKVWLIASLYVSVPAVPLAILITLKIVSSAEYLSRGLPGLEIPGWTGMLIACAIALLAVSMFAYTFILLVMSSSSALKPLDLSFKALMICCKNWIASFVITTVVLIANILLFLPQSLADADVMKVPVILQVLAQFWAGGISLILAPFSIAPFCVLVKAADEGEV